MPADGESRQAQIYKTWLIRKSKRRGAQSLLASLRGNAPRHKPPCYPKHEQRERQRIMRTEESDQQGREVISTGSHSWAQSQTAALLPGSRPCLLISTEAPPLQRMIIILSSARFTGRIVADEGLNTTDQYEHEPILIKEIPMDTSQEVEWRFTQLTHSQSLRLLNPSQEEGAPHSMVSRSIQCPAHRRAPRSGWIG